MESTGAPKLFLVRDREPLGTFFRPSTKDYGHFANLLSAGHPGGSGVVIEGRSLDNSHVEELRDATVRNGMDFVLDSMGVEMATPTGWTLAGLKEMPWVPRKRFSPAQFTKDERRQLVIELARVATEVGATAILAPSRFVERLERDDLVHDMEIAVALRESLNAAGGQTIRIYYPLATTLQLLASSTARGGLLATLRDGLAADAFDALWVRAARFGVAAGPTNLRRYVAGVRGLHELNVPIVGDRAGTAGLGMIAVGVVAGVTSGITVGERFDPRAPFRPSRGSGFGMPPRVYISAIGAFMKRADAEALMKNPSVKNWFSCQHPCCSRGGLAATIADPRRHFVVNRVAEVRGLAEVPVSMRPAYYMENWLRRASDRATKAMQIQPSLEPHRVHLDAMRSTMAAIIEEDASPSPSHPVTRSAVHMRVRRGA